MTAKQVILQRLREATDEVHYGEYVGRDGDLW
jgi:N utilization substance protein A